MALLGPIVVIAETPAASTVEALGEAGAFPIVEARWADARAAIDQIEPCALVLAEPDQAPDPAIAQTLAERIASMSPLMPALARMRDAEALPLPNALAVSVAEPLRALIDRLRSALRIRNLHATVLRRAGPDAEGCAFPSDGGLEHATVLCLGRGRRYPELAVAIGERAGLIGAMSVETAARYLNARDIEGIVIGDGFGPRVVDALITVLAEDVRFRDLPLGVLGSRAIDDEPCPTSSSSTASRSASSSGFCRSCACRLSRHISSGCSSRSRPKARSIRRPGCSRAKPSGAISHAP